jgi:hypothetical protein
MRTASSSLSRLRISHGTAGGSVPFASLRASVGMRSGSAIVFAAIDGTGA